MAGGMAVSNGRYRAWIAVLIVACLSASTASAEVMGNDLKEYCRFVPTMNQSTAMCLGYISGTLDTIRGMGVMLKKKLACEPPGVTGDQIVSMTIKYMADHPENLHFTGSSLILNLYTKSFPCKGQ
jgi:hypothetical protein